jgi:hypothetical protein
MSNGPNLFVMSFFWEIEELEKSTGNAMRKKRGTTMRAYLLVAWWGPFWALCHGFINRSAMEVYLWQFVEGGEHGGAILDESSTSLPSFKSRSGGEIQCVAIIHHNGNKCSVTMMRLPVSLKVSSTPAYKGAWRRHHGSEADTTWSPRLSPILCLVLQAICHRPILRNPP